MKQKTKIFKIILLVVVIAIMVAVTIYLIPTFKELSSEAGQQAFKQKVNDSGFVGFLMLFGLQFAQIFLFIIPGEPIEILAGLCYGSLWGAVFIMLSAAIISAFIYLLVHKLGREFIYEFVKPEKIEKIENNIALENEIKNIKDYTYLVLTSKNGVDIFFDKLDELGLDCRALANIKVCSIGAATSKAIQRRGIKPDIQPKNAVGESLYDELKDIVTKDDKILIPRAKNARKFLVEKLNEISNVTEVITYESVMDDSKKEEAIKALEEGNLDYITFASSSTVTNFINLIGEENKDKLSNTKIISIGRITTKTILDNNLEVYKQAENASIESMIEAMSE